MKTKYKISLIAGFVGVWLSYSLINMIMLITRIQYVWFYFFVFPMSVILAYKFEKVIKDISEENPNER
jgi:hypothetical protein